jgi:hypothetical protein
MHPTRPLRKREKGTAAKLPQVQIQEGTIWLYSVTRRPRDQSAVGFGSFWCVGRWLDPKIGGVSGCLHSSMHCGKAQSDAMEACVTTRRTARLQSSGRVPLSKLWPEIEPDSTFGMPGVFHSVPE